MSGYRLDAGSFNLGAAGQIALGVADLARSDAFYAGVLALRRLHGSSDQVVYDCGDVQLMIQQREDHNVVRPGSPVYFRVDDIRGARQDLEARGVVFTDPIQVAAALRDHDLWTTSFRDPDGHVLALTMEGPKGFAV